MRQHLRIVLESFDHAQALIEIEQRRNATHPLADILGTGRALQQRIEVALREEMIEGVDVAHGSVSCCPRTEPQSQRRRVGKAMAPNIQFGKAYRAPCPPATTQL